MSDYRIETKCIQSGYEPGNGEPRILPIYQSTTFRYTSSEQMDVCSILKNPDIFIRDFRIRLTTPLLLRSAIWKAAWQLC